MGCIQDSLDKYIDTIRALVYKYQTPITLHPRAWQLPQLVEQSHRSCNCHGFDFHLSPEIIFFPDQFQHYNVACKQVSSLHALLFLPMVPSLLYMLHQLYLWIPCFTSFTYGYHLHRHFLRLHALLYLAMVTIFTVLIHVYMLHQLYL